MKSIILSLFILAYTTSAFAAVDYLTYLSNSNAWKNFRPLNYEVVEKKGDVAFFWPSDAEAEQIADSKLQSREPYILFKPSVSVTAERKTGSGLLIYKTKYSFDEMSRRVTPLNQENLDQRRNMIFLGCSFTLGTGVADDQTLPYYFSQYRPHFNVFNMGIYAAGANDILDDMRSFRRYSDIPKSGGLVIYTALPEHIKRSVCNWNCYTAAESRSVLKKSNYQYDASTQSLVNRGSFEDSQPISNLIFSLLSKIGLIESVNIPLKLTDEQIDLYVLMVADMKKVAKERFGAELYFTMYPGYYEYWDRIKPMLKKHDIKYLDLSKIDFKGPTAQRQSIVYDGHPTPLANYLLASLMHHQLPK